MIHSTMKKRHSISCYNIIGTSYRYINSTRSNKEQYEALSRFTAQQKLLMLRCIMILSGVYIVIQSVQHIHQKQEEQQHQYDASMNKIMMTIYTLSVLDESSSSSTIRNHGIGTFQTTTGTATTTIDDADTATILKEVTPTSVRQHMMHYIQQDYGKTKDIDFDVQTYEPPWDFLLLNNNNRSLSNSSADSSIDTSRSMYWNLIQNYATATMSVSHAHDNVNNNNGNSTSDIFQSCTDAPGEGYEGGYGAYQLLTQKIQIFPMLIDVEQQIQNVYPYDDADDRSVLKMKSHPADTIRVLCAIYTHTAHHQSHIRMITVTWGHLCDGILVFTSSSSSSNTNTTASNTTTTTTNNNSGNHDDEYSHRSFLGIISIPYTMGDESYGNMWQKTRAIMNYIHTNNVMEQYDYIHLSGDDIYLIVPNLKYFLYQQEMKQQQSSQKDKWGNIILFAGQWVKQKWYPFIGGGPGYTISRSVLVQYMKYAYHQCATNVLSSSEDRYFSTCIQQYTNITITDTRDTMTGEQTYHDVAPQQLYDGISSKYSKRKPPSFHSRLLSYYETLPYPNNMYITVTANPPYRFFNIVSDNITSKTDSNNSGIVVVGSKFGLQSAATYSTSFHKIKHPLHMLRIHALLYPILCQPH